MREAAVRVLHVTTSGRMGGAERLLVDIARTGQRSSVELEVCTLLPSEDLGSALANEGITCHSLHLRDIRDFARGMRQLVRLIQRGRYDIVHSHLVHASAMGSAAARLARGVRSVMTRHYAMHVAWYGSPLDRLLDRLALRLSDRVFAISQAVRKTLVEMDHVSPERIEVVPNGIDPTRVLELAARTSAERWASPATVIGTVGSLHPRKGHAYLLRALAGLGDLHPPLETVLIGAGPLKGELETLTRALGLAARVRFTGYMANPYGLLSGLDLYVQPSIEEGFGIAVLEAMALSKAVVATRAGGLPEVVVDGVTGVLVPPGDARALATALGQLACDVARRFQFGSHGAERVRTEFHAAAAAERYTAAYRRLLS